MSLVEGSSATVLGPPGEGAATKESPATCRWRDHADQERGHGQRGEGLPGDLKVREEAPEIEGCRQRCTYSFINDVRDS